MIRPMIRKLLKAFRRPQAAAVPLQRVYCDPRMPAKWKPAGAQR